MRIGVYLPTIDPKRGGAFTFQESVFKAILLLAEKTPHDWVFFTAASNAPSSTTKIRYASLRRCIFTKIWDFYAEFVQAFQDSYFKRRWLRPRTSLQRAVEQNGVQLMWFVDHSHRDVDVPFFFTVFDLQNCFQPWFPEVSAGGEWERREVFGFKAMAKASRVIVPNRQAEKELLLRYPVLTGRTIQAPHVAREFSREELSASEKEPREFSRPYLFYPAQFWAHKNHRVLLATLRELKEKYRIDFDLALCGSDKGNLAHVREMVRSLGLEDRVHFFGFVKTEELIQLYRNAFALVFPTFFGPENIPPLEAFALGCPVITSQYAGSEEQLGDAALQVETTSPEAFALAIKRLRDETGLRATLIEKGRRQLKGRDAESYVQIVLAEISHFAAIRACWP